MCLQETEFTADSVYMEAPSGYSNGLDVVAATPAIIVEPPGVIDTKLTGDLSQDPADVESKFEVPAGVKLENFSDDYDEIKEAGTILKEEFGEFCFWVITREINQCPMVNKCSTIAT